MDESTTEQTVFQREVEIAASPETVWEFLVDPEKAVALEGAAGDVRRAAGRRLPDRGRPRPHRRAASSSSSTRRAGSSTRGAGSRAATARTRSRRARPRSRSSSCPSGGGRRSAFTHRDLPTPSRPTATATAGTTTSARLAVAAAGGDPGPDPWTVVGLTTTRNEHHQRQRRGEDDGEVRAGLQGRRHGRRPRRSGSASMDAWSAWFGEPRRLGRRHGQPVRLVGRGRRRLNGGATSASPATRS